MTNSASVAACAVGAVAMLLVGSTAFTAGLQVMSRSAGSGPRQLIGHSPAPEPGMGATTSSLSIGVVAGLAAAALVAVNRGLVARKVVDQMDEWHAEWAAAAPKVGKDKESAELAIPYPAGTDAWIEDETTDLWYTGGPNLGPIGMYNHGAVFAGGIVGTEYAGWGGAYQFDPLKLANRYPEHLPWYREAELKHGRVAMLACVGLVAPDGFRLPFDACSGTELDMMTSHNKLIGPALGEGPMWWLLIFCGVIESIRFKQVGLGFGELTLENAGDMNFGKGFLPQTKEGQVQMKIKELKNGRLAMLAFSGAITQGILWETHHFPFVPTN